MSNTQKQKSVAHNIYKYKAQKDVQIVVFAFFPLAVTYILAYIKTSSIIYSNIKFFVRIVIIAQIIQFMTQTIVWKNCTETIIVRTFGQVGFLTSYLWSRLLLASSGAFLDSSLKTTLLIPEKIFMTAYLIRIMKYIMMLNQIVQIDHYKGSQYIQTKSN
ncbi:Hypothetical_protein [Hexamita inflata]|uniref:Hypothetical_protein n=1 Tax=Hexamita inflata TaxID=28002 RepID=A0AA86US49_9EUKA|nr:Hypothetical protein HINF_LOCUS35628 [Hexamita inflata]